MQAEDNDVVWLHARGQVTIRELSECCGVAEEVVLELVEYGALRPMDPHAQSSSFSADCVQRLRTAARLGSDLELEVPAIALVLSFLERIDRLEAELRQVSAQLGRPRG